jgi:hypothetical protein
MRYFLRFGILISTFLLASASGQAQQWCTYNPAHDARFNCGYSSAQACEKATRDTHGACTLDPFYD